MKSPATISGAAPVPASPSAPPPATAVIDAYFGQLQAAFAQVRRQTPSSADREFQLAGHRLRLHFAGEALAPILTAALAHLPAATSARGLAIDCWDGAATGEALPAPPWPWPTVWPATGFITPLGNTSVRVSVCPTSGVIFLYRADTGQAVFWTPDARKLPTYYHGSPFLTLLSWWIQTRATELNLLHAACVGTDRGAVLLVGPGGSGKSTTALLCAEAGLDYLSDDYCMVAADPAPTAFCLYSSGKLHRDHLAKFPGLAALAVDPCADQFEKPVIFLGQAGKFAVTGRAALRAILVPTVSGQPDTLLEPTNAAEALRALAPSTLLQLPGTAPATLRSLAGLTRRLPCLRLRLGTRLEAIAPTVRELLTRLA